MIRDEEGYKEHLDQKLFMELFREFKKHVVEGRYYLFRLSKKEEVEEDNYQTKIRQEILFNEGNKSLISLCISLKEFIKEKYSNKKVRKGIMISTDEEVAEILGVSVEKAKEIKQWIKRLSQEVLDDEFDAPF